MATVEEHVASLDESTHAVSLLLARLYGLIETGALSTAIAAAFPARRTVVQYDFRDDETWAYCNDGTVWKLAGRGSRTVDAYVQVVTATIPQPE